MATAIKSCVSWRQELTAALVELSPQLHAKEVTDHLAGIWGATEEKNELSQWIRASACWTAREVYGPRANYWYEERGLKPSTFSEMVAVFERHFAALVAERRRLQDVSERHGQPGRNGKMLRDAAAQATFFESLTIKHHIACLSLDLDTALQVLEEAQTAHWTVPRIQTRVRQIVGRAEPRPVIPAAIVRTIANPNKASDWFDALVAEAKNAGQIDLLRAALDRAEE